jgi:hypothetical protein
METKLVDRPPTPALASKWKFAGLALRPKNPNTAEKCYWITAANGKRRRLLNVELPPRAIPELLRYAICPECGYAYSELLVWAAQELDLVDADATLAARIAQLPPTAPACSECRWEAVALIGLALQRECGVSLGIEDNEACDTEAERQERRRILIARSHVMFVSTGGYRVVRIRGRMPNVAELVAVEGAIVPQAS